MPAVTELILLLIFPVACVCSNVVIVTHNTTINLTCRIPSDLRVPGWYVNGTEVTTTGDRYSVSTSNGADNTAILKINGNLTCETVNVSCEIYNTTEHRFVRMHNTTLRFKGRLPSPENVHIKEHFNSSTIEWNPPYSALNNDIIRVDPHITHYTVYITDNYTGNIIVKENVTETQFTYINRQQDSDLCLMCQVSAWNAGGEGEVSEPVEDNTPQVPRNVTAESITVRGTVKPNVVHIRMNNVDVICSSRIPEFFLITLMTLGGNVLNETRRHQPGEGAYFTISLPQSVDVCSLRVRIRAGNSAGMSAPSETVEVECSGDSTDSTTTASATTVLTATSTGSGSEGNSEQGVNTTLIVIIIGVIAAVGVTLIVAVGIMCFLKLKSKNSKVKHSDQTDDPYTGSPSLGGPVPLYKLPVAEMVYVTSEHTTSRPVARDPEHTANWMPTLDSAPSTLQTSVAMAPKVQTQTSYSPTNSPSTVSGRSDDILLPPSPPVPASRPNLVYEQVDVQQTQVPPPAHDDHVQYAQLKQQDKM